MQREIKNILIIEDLQHILFRADTKGQKNSFPTGISQISDEIYVFTNHEIIQLKNWENAKSIIIFL